MRAWVVGLAVVVCHSGCLSSNPDWNDGAQQQSTSTGSTGVVSSSATSSSPPISSTTNSTSMTDGSTTAPTSSSSSSATEFGGSTTAAVDGTSGGIGDAYLAAVLSDNPVGYWRLGDAVTPVASDHLELNPGTYFGAVSLGQPGLTTSDDTAVSFPGDSPARLEVADVFGFSGQVQFSVEMWVQHDAHGAGCIVGKSSFTGTDYEGWFVASNNDRIRFDRHPGTLANAPDPPLGVPYHLAVTYDGVTARVYFDGVLAGSRINQSMVVEHPGLFTIGDCANWGNFTGIIDEVAVYDYSLSAERVVAHAAAGTSQ